MREGRGQLEHMFGGCIAPWALRYFLSLTPGSGLWSQHRLCHRCCPLLCVKHLWDSGISCIYFPRVSFFQSSCHSRTICSQLKMPQRNSLFSRQWNPCFSSHPADPELKAMGFLKGNVLVMNTSFFSAPGPHFPENLARRK